MINALAITGPTASGKTSVSIALAKHLNAEIICCDSMQIYREMDIGTAKATGKERAETPHYMLDFLSPCEDYSAEAYRSAAVQVAAEISLRGALPMFVGGTGLYIDSVMRAPMNNVPESSKEYRDKLLSECVGDPCETLWQRLRLVDPESAELIHKNNLRRVIRALEIYDATGKPKSYFDKLSREKNADITVGMITLDFHNRENLYARINERVDVMMRDGLLAEVDSLYKSGRLPKNSTAAQAIGYKEIIEYLDGESTLDEAVETIKLSTRRYAKRQLTWFRHEKDAYRLYLDREDGSMKETGQIIAEALSAANEFIEGFKLNNYESIRT